MRADFGEASWLCVFVCWQTGELTETVVSCDLQLAVAYKGVSWRGCM